MPLARYFIFVGGTLVALLLAVNRYVAEGQADMSTRPVEYAPALPQARDLSIQDFDIQDFSIHDFDIRIHSDHKWPERLLLDTELPR